MIGDAGCARGFAGVASLAAAAALFATGAAAGGDGGTCPAVWAEYVETVGEIIAPLGPDFPLLFVSREGDVYDCLGRVRDPDFLERASFFEKRLPIDRSGILDADPATWPVNICTNAWASWLDMTPYAAIHLPLRRDILASRSCRDRVLRAASDILLENRND